MTTHLCADSESQTGAQPSTFRNTENVSIDGGTFSTTSTIAEQRTHMDSGRQPQAHSGNSHRSERERDQRRPYFRNPYPKATRQNGHDPELSLTSGPSCDQHRMPAAATLPVATTPNSQQATFGNADVANVSGGIFLNSHTVQLYHGVPPEDTSCSHIQDYNIVHAGVGITRTDTNLSRGLGGLTRPSNSETTIPSAVRADYDIYYHQLLAKQRGSPMWIPGPDMNLPTEYRREGIRIGDVGILYRSEGFSFLFNIFLPADHPTNEGRVPPGFEPLNLRHGPKKQVVFGRKSYLTSTSVAVSSNMGSSNLIFETSAAEGAVLVMPDGAITEDLMCRKSIKEYLAKNAETWYEFVSEECELEVDNGDIRLVIGFDKVSSWGIATSACSIGERVHLEFKNIDDISQTYSWHCVGSGSGRVGPCDREMQGIMNPQETGRLPPLQNQCVFLRTLNFDLSGKCWNGLMNHRIRSSDSAPPESHYGGSQPGHQPGTGASGSDGGGLGGGESHSTSGSVSFYATQSGLSVKHPSSSINKILLDKYPRAQIAITEDANWISVITKDDVEIPKADELCTRLLATLEVCEEDGIITFRSEEDTSSLTFGSKHQVYDSAMVDPFDSLQPTEDKGKGPETSNFQDPSKFSLLQDEPSSAIPSGRYLPMESGSGATDREFLHQLDVNGPSRTREIPALSKLGSRSQENPSNHQSHGLYDENEMNSTTGQSMEGSERISPFVLRDTQPQPSASGSSDNRYRYNTRLPHSSRPAHPVSLQDPRSSSRQRGRQQPLPHSYLVLWKGEAGRKPCLASTPFSRVGKMVMKPRSIDDPKVTSPTSLGWRNMTPPVSRNVAYLPNNLFLSGTPKSHESLGGSSFTVRSSSDFPAAAISSFTDSPSVTNTPVDLYPHHETTHAYTADLFHLSPNLLHVPIHDTGTHSAPVSPSRPNKTFPPFDFQNLQQFSPSTSELSSLKMNQLPFFDETRHPSTAPAGPNQAFLQPPSLSFYRRTPTEDYRRPSTSGRRRTSSASFESFFVNTNTHPITTNYRETSPHFSDASSAGSPSPFPGHDPIAGVETISSASPASLSIAIDAASVYNSPASGPDFSPSVGSASPSGSISLNDLNLGRSLPSGANSLTDVSDVGSENDYYSPFNQPPSLELEPYQFQQQHPQFSESGLRSDGNMPNYSLDNSVQVMGLQPYQDVGRPQRPRLPSVTLTPADGVAPGTPPDSMLFSIPLPSEVLGMPLTGSPFESNAMGGVAMTRYNIASGMGAINPSTLSGFPPLIDMPSGMASIRIEAGYPPISYQPQPPTFEGQEVSSSTAGSSQPQRHTSPERALQEHTHEDKLKVYQILTTSSERAEIIPRLREVGRPHLSRIYQWALLRRVKLTPASEAKARKRRTREATFQCLLCEAFLTTNDNLQNHYRSHLCLNPYHCNRCGKEYRTYGSLNRHLNSSKGRCPRRNHIPEQS